MGTLQASLILPVAQIQELDRTTEAFARMNFVRKVEGADWNGVPTCGNIAV